MAKKKTLPIPATFSLYRGTAAIGKAIRALPTTERAAGVLDNLERKCDYTLVATAPSYQGQAIAPHHPPKGVLSFTLYAGQTLRLLDQFCFQPCGGRAMGMVLDDACSEGVGGVSMLLSRLDGQDSHRHAVTDPNGVFVVDDILPGDYVASLEHTKATLSDGTTWDPRARPMPQITK